MSTRKFKPIPKELLDRLDYDPETGILRYNVNIYRKIKAGQVAGTKSKDYVRINMGRVIYLAHRVAWAKYYGDCPVDVEIDHRNLNKHDNRIENLRIASHPQNNMNIVKKCNNKSGVKGVSWHKAAGKWVAQITKDYKLHYLGLFDDIQEAAKAYASASKSLHGEFGRV
jgi:hypothetical protein